MNKKLYKVYDKAGERLVGYFDNKELLLINTYNYLKQMKESEGDVGEWINYIGSIDDFHIYEINLNEIAPMDERRVHIIDYVEYKHFMLYGPREINIDKILNEENG